MKKTQIIVFAKAPVSGKVKTRLIGELGSSNAARLAELMLYSTLEKSLSANTDIVELCCAPDINHEDWVGFCINDNIIISIQGDGDLGQRMARAANRAINNGYSAILIGTDCPSLTANMLNEIIADLAKNDCVIIPAYDGGYVLLALNTFNIAIFKEIKWSTNEVCQKTIDIIQSLGLKLLIKPPMRDIDNKEDLQFIPDEWKQELFNL